MTGRCTDGRLEGFIFDQQGLESLPFTVLDKQGFPLNIIDQEFLVSAKPFPALDHKDLTTGREEHNLLTGLLKKTEERIIP